jgi:hypothetical protein
MQQAALTEEEQNYRLVRDNIASAEECRTMALFAEAHARVGDGYYGAASPHAEGETFSGYAFEPVSHHALTPGYRQLKKLLAIARRRPTTKVDQLRYLNTPEHKLGLQLILRARDQLMETFGLDELWLEYGHLVLREATGNNVALSRDKFSHPWHYDNQTDPHRTHTALLYLNDDFTGGQTLFEQTDFGPERAIQPKPGTLAGFTVAENNHAVSRLLAGKRYLIAMWFSTHADMKARHESTFSVLR